MAAQWKWCGAWSRWENFLSWGCIIGVSCFIWWECELFRSFTKNVTTVMEFVQCHKASSGNATSSLKERGLSDQSPGNALFEEQKELEARLGRSLRDLGQRYWSKWKERTMGTLKAGTSSRENSLGIQKREEVKNTCQIAFPRVAFSLSHHGLSLWTYKWLLSTVYCTHIFVGIKEINNKEMKKRKCN